MRKPSGAVLTVRSTRSGCGLRTVRGKVASPPGSTVIDGKTVVTVSAVTAGVAAAVGAGD